MNRTEQGSERRTKGMWIKEKPTKKIRGKKKDAHKKHDNKHKRTLTQKYFLYQSFLSVLGSQAKCESCCCLPFFTLRKQARDALSGLADCFQTPRPKPDLCITDITLDCGVKIHWTAANPLLEWANSDGQRHVREKETRREDMALRIYPGFGSDKIGEGEWEEE